MGKKKDKSKKNAAEAPADDDRPRRKELTREIDRLRAQNEVLRARLERIAEVATSKLPDDVPVAEPAIVLLSTQEQ